MPSRPGGSAPSGTLAVARDHLLTAHVLAYEAIHRARPDALVTTNNACLSLYDHDRMLTDLLLARSAGIERNEVDAWLAERRRRHEQLVPSSGPGEWLLRRASAALTAGPGSGRASPRDSFRRALDAVYLSPHERTLDVGRDRLLRPARRPSLPGARPSHGRGAEPAAGPGALGRRARPGRPDPLARAPALAGARPARSGWSRTVCATGSATAAPTRALDGWDRPRYLRENLAAVMAALDEGVPVAGYWHWSLMDNYEWGSYEPRFGLLRDRPAPGRARDHLAGHRCAGRRRRRHLPADHRGVARWRPLRAGVSGGDRSVLA